MIDPLQDLPRQLSNELVPRIVEILRERADPGGRVSLDEGFFETVATDAKALLERLVPHGVYESRVWFETQPGRLFYDRDLILELFKVDGAKPREIVACESNRFRIKNFMRLVFDASSQPMAWPTATGDSHGGAQVADGSGYSEGDQRPPLVFGRRLVAVYDLLGFRNFIERSSLSEAATMIHKIHRWATLPNAIPTVVPNESAFPDVSPQKPLAHVTFISDTIVATAVGDGPEDELKLVYFVWRSMQMLLAMGFPVRGAIVRDEIYVSSDLHTVVGRSLVRAYEKQNAHSWSGMMLDSAIVDDGGEVFGRVRAGGNLISALVVPYDVPLKNGRRDSAYAINWRLNLVVKTGTRSLFQEHPDAEVRRKIGHTLEFAKVMRERGLLYADENRIPCEFRCYFIGDTEPPFPHGDEY